MTRLGGEGVKQDRSGRKGVRGRQEAGAITGRE